MQDLQATFDAQPQITLVATDSGHAYGKAKFYSVCKLTGIAIQALEPIRKLTVTTRGGQVWTGYTSNAIIGHLGFIMQRDLSISQVSKCSEGWVSDAMAAMEAAPAQTRLELTDKNGQRMTWTKQDGGTYRPSKGAIYSRSNAKQVASKLARSKSWRLFQVIEPTQR